MDIIIFRTHELPIALGALRAVVRYPSQRQQHFIEVIARLHGSPLRARGLRATPSQLTAATIRDPHRRKRLVQLAVVLATVDGRVEREHAKAVAALARVLEVDEPAVRTLPKLAAGRALATRIDLLGRIMGKFLREAWRAEGFRGVRQFLGFFGGGRGSRAIAERFAALGGYAEGSLGRALHQHCRSHGFALPGERGGIPARIVFHDIGHLLSGYDTDPTGEIRQAAFQAGFVRKDGFAFLFFGIVQFHLGIKVTPVADPEVGLFEIEPVMQALARGAACATDLSDDWDFWSAAKQPLELVRANLRVPPLKAAAASHLSISVA